MSRTDDDPGPQIRRAREEARRLAESAERGRAYTPLTAWFADDPSAVGLGLLVVATDHEALGPALAWLSGLSSDVLSAWRPHEAGDLLRIGRAGGADSHEEPDQSLRETLAQPMPRVRVDTSGARATLLGARGGAALLADPVALSAVAGEASLLVIAAPADPAFDDEARAAFGDLATLFDAVLPVEIAAHGEEAVARPRPWRLDTRTPMLPTVALDPQAPPPLPPWFTDADDPMAVALASCASSRALRLGGDMLEDELGLRLASGRARQAETAHATRRSGVDTGDAETRARVDALREGLQVTLAGLGKEIQAVSRQALMPHGSITKAVQEAAATLRPAELVARPKGKTTKFSIHDSYLTRVGERMRAAVKAHVQDVLRTLRDKQREVEAATEEALTTLEGRPVPYALPSIDERGLWGAMRPFLGLELNYASERQRRNFIHRLGEGRRAMFSVMMLVSMIGMITGFQARSQIGPVFGAVMGVLLVTGIVRTYKSWRDEDDEFREKELDKIRDQAVTEAKRGASEALREASSIVGEHLAEFSRRPLKEIDERVKALLDVRRAESDAARKGTQEEAKRTEALVRDVQGLLQQHGRWRQTCRESETTARRSLREAMRATEGRP